MPRLSRVSRPTSTRTLWNLRPRASWAGAPPNRPVRRRRRHAGAPPAHPSGGRPARAPPMAPRGCGRRGGGLCGSRDPAVESSVPRHLGGGDMDQQVGQDVGDRNGCMLGNHRGVKRVDTWPSRAARHPTRSGACPDYILDTSSSAGTWHSVSCSLGDQSMGAARPRSTSFGVTPLGAQPTIVPGCREG